MSSKKIAGLVVAALGAILLVFSYYIAEQVTEGRMKIDRAQGQVNTVNSLFSLSPATKDVGRGLTGSAQRKIDAGSLDVAEYSALAHKLQLGGIVLIIVGIGILVFYGKKRHS